VSNNFPVYEVHLEHRKLEKSEPGLEMDGYLEKFWIEHPQLGRSLVKLDRELTAKAWTEKISSEIAKQLNVPCAEYEFGILKGFDDYPENTQVTISPDFQVKNSNYYQGVELLEQTELNSGYSVANTIMSLEFANISLPENYIAPNGVATGADLFVGYLVLDSLIDNGDRHSKNWGYNESLTDGVRHLTPAYDHGVSLGIILDSNDYKNISVSQYLEYGKSAFGDKHNAVIQSAAELRPEAAKVWLEQLAQIDRQQIKEIFDRIPSDRISPGASKFAQELLEHNREKLLNLSKVLFTEDTQQKRVNNVAPVLTQYLLLEDSYEISTSSASIKFDLKSKVLTYQDKNNPDERLKAKRGSGEWIDVGSSISADKESYILNKVSPAIEQTLQNKQAKNSSTSEDRQKRHRSR